MGAYLPNRRLTYLMGVYLPTYLMGAYLPNVGLATCLMGGLHTFPLRGLTTYLPIYLIELVCLPSV